MTLEEVARELRARRLSAEEVVRASLHRIDRLEPRLRAFITLTAERAIAEARAVSPSATFAGAPIALKDLFDTAGVRTTAGSRIFADRVPTADAHVVARLRAAGAISVGKASTHEWAFGVTSQNPHFGGTRNPWDLSRIPGGSSGGSAAALAAGLVHGALGSDTGGSIRIPASLCGVVGLKPTFGRVSTRGVIPLSWNLDHVGPMARTVRDVALLYMAIAGHDPHDPGSADVPVDDALAGIEGGARGLRIGAPRGHFLERSDPEVARAVREAFAVLEREGASVEECAFPPSEALLDTQRTILCTDAAAFHRERMAERAGEIGADVLARLRTGAGFSGTDYAAARRRRDEIRHEVAALFARYDVLAMPATAIAAPPAEGADAVAEAARLTVTTSPFNLTGLPAISLPCGFTASGLPIGLQLAAAPWREATVLRAARAYERVTEWSACRPPLAVSA
ncbi:MAG: Asp-tRNA(Asn)/Glu-tRNA(Gln) amidotransferase subunit GatA [Chloroflexi bacterium]|nr:Asp-tRNA(Asn)/Glu-tRNA(Gln) amidotransferase subunit GatA [Chloroflexota bacterium]